MCIHENVCVGVCGCIVCVVCVVHVHAHMLCEDAPCCVIPHEVCEKCCIITDCSPLPCTLLQDYW